MTDKPRIAPDGFLWVCLACGKTSRGRYGEPKSGWDESCFLNSELFAESRLVRGEGGRVTRILEDVP